MRELVAYVYSYEGQRLYVARDKHPLVFTEHLDDAQLFSPGTKSTDVLRFLNLPRSYDGIYLHHYAILRGDEY